MSYPKCVYHKDYDHRAPDQEKLLYKYCKIVKSEVEHKALGLDYGDHPAAKSESKKEEKSVVEETSAFKKKLK